MITAFRKAFLSGLCLAAIHAAGADTAPVLGEQTKFGELSDKPANAGADAVAQLHSRGADYNLVAKGAFADEVATLLKKHVPVEVTGQVNGDTMTVTSIKEAPATPTAADGGAGEKKSRKKGEKKKGEKKKKKKDAA
jgi:hypothetical protein